MPIYEYRCKECQQIFEEWQKDFETHDFACPVCGAESERVMSNTSFVLKGSGWYVTDYGKGTSGGNGSSASSCATSSDSSSSAGESAGDSPAASSTAAPKEKSESKTASAPGGDS